MQAELEDLATLLEIQEIDLLSMQAKKKRSELPQRIKITRMRKKRAEVAEKLDQVLELQEKAQIDYRKVEDEDKQLEEKQQRAQEIIDAAGSDYRKVESHSREMASTAKRRETLAERMTSMSAQLDKIAGVRKQIEDAISASEADEEKLATSLEAEDGKLLAQIDELEAKRAELVDHVPAQLVKLYEKTAEKTGGVAIGRLDENRCGVCRSPIDGGRLIELHNAAPLGNCPNCRRLLVIA